MSWAWYGLPIGPRVALPWEMGSWAPLPSMPVFRPVVGRPPPVPPIRVDVQMAQGSSQDVVPRAQAVAGRLRSGPPPLVQDAADRAKAIQSWVAILKAVQEGGGLPAAKNLERLARETLETKATATLTTRMCSLGLYKRWASQQGLVLYPFREGVIHEYLRAAALAAPTRGQRFLEAAAFLGHMFKVDVEPAFGPQSRGIAAGGLKRKRLTVKRPPLTVSMLEGMEDMVVSFENGSAHVDAPRSKIIFVVFVLWCVHTRARFGDAARVNDEPSLDVVEGKGFAESRARPGRHKIGHGERGAGKAMPQVACAFGVTGKPWAQAWLRLRSEAGLDAAADDCLMPEVLADWPLGAGRMPTPSGGCC